MIYKSFLTDNNTVRICKVFFFSHTRIDKNMFNICRSVVSYTHMYMTWELNIVMRLSSFYYATIILLLLLLLLHKTYGYGC